MLRNIVEIPLPLLRRLRHKALSIPNSQASFAVRGFCTSNAGVRFQLEKIGETFLLGYHAALKDRGIIQLSENLEKIDPSVRGFAYEGAGLGLSLLDRLMFRRTMPRVIKFLAGPGEPHRYMVHVGIGWMLARLRWRIGGVLSQLDPLLRWLAIDGFGFHEGYFKTGKTVFGQDMPRALAGYQLRAFDQGVGRSLWFSTGAAVGFITDTIARFAPHRRADLWSGIGLASTYAGGADRESLGQIRSAAGEYLPHVAQGSVFAAKTRLHAGNVTAQTRIACEILCGIQVDEAAALADRTLLRLPTDTEIPAYEIWRQRIQSRFDRRLEVA